MKNHQKKKMREDAQKAVTIAGKTTKVILWIVGIVAAVAIIYAFVKTGSAIYGAWQDFIGRIPGGK